MKVLFISKEDVVKIVHKELALAMKMFFLAAKSVLGTGRGKRRGRRGGRKPKTDGVKVTRGPRKARAVKEPKEKKMGRPRKSKNLGGPGTGEGLVNPGD